MRVWVCVRACLYSRLVWFSCVVYPSCHVIASRILSPLV